MIGRISIVAAAAAVLLALSAPADARHGGGFGGFRGGGFHGGGFRMGGFHGGPRFHGGGPRFYGGGFRRVGFHRPAFGYRRPFYGRPFYRPYRYGFHRPHWRPYWRKRPFIRAGFIGGGYYGSCWRWRLTPWGWRRVFVCGYRRW